MFDQDFLMHVGRSKRDGAPVGSGRFPLGSGEDPYQHLPSLSGEDASFLAQVREIRKSGIKDGTKIAEMLGMPTTEYRDRITVTRERERQVNAARASYLKSEGYSDAYIANELGVSEGTVRNYLKPHEEVKIKKTEAAVNVLKDSVKRNGYIDVGKGSELYLGVSKQKLNAALRSLTDEGYEVYSFSVPQISNPQQKTTMKVLAPPGTEWKDVYNNQDKIHLIDEHSSDGGLTYYTIEKPQSVDSKRVMIRYAEDGGKNKDGLIELRRGVEDISLGDAQYAQVRIAVDDTHYIKGMALYNDNMPKGVDIIFNTNKTKDVPMKSSNKDDPQVLKPLKSDPDNPFGATIKRDDELVRAQRHYIGKDGKEHLSALNIVNEEGNWNEWSKTIASQMLSKQDVSLAKRQLNLAYDQKQSEYEEIKNLTNAAVRQKLLLSFADDCDASATHLKAAALPGQKTHVIIPLTEIKDTEIYAPNYNTGDRVVLIRFPHGGKFEIPELTVNNRNKQGKEFLGSNPIDAVGINHKVAERLSGADFDGDTVLVIPNNDGRIKSRPALKELENFDPHSSYPYHEGMKVMSKQFTQNEMGRVSNLITDMTIKGGASDDEIARAVKYSMVVIDANKHKLDYKQAYKDCRIDELKKKYQTGGASTLLSRAKNEKDVPELEQKYKRFVVDGKERSFNIDPNTGKKIMEPTGRTYEKVEVVGIDPNTGKKVYAPKVDKKTGEPIVKEYRTRIPQMELVDDAYKLSSGTVIENAYAQYANRMKALANQARKDYISTTLEKTPYSRSAAEIYKDEVRSLDSKLRNAQRNAPRERQAQMLANLILKAQVADNPDMSNEDKKKAGGRALVTARARVGAGKERVDISPKEWEAIQNGAVSYTKLLSILDNTDMDKIKEYATPRINGKTVSVTAAKLATARSMIASGYTQKEVAEQLGISVSTLNKALND